MTCIKEELKRKLSEYLNVHYVEKKKFFRVPNFLSQGSDKKKTQTGNRADYEEYLEDKVFFDDACTVASELKEADELREEPPGNFQQLPKGSAAPKEARSYNTAPVKKIDDYILESFVPDGVAKKLNLYMYERDITTAMIYERCFVSRKLISKITSKEGYHPSKNTMLALCIGLRLNLQEGEEFLLLAGYSFSYSSKYDLIIKFMLENGVYDIDTINEMLFEYDQPCIGA